MNNTKCIIIEDEPLAEEKLRGFILQVSWLQLCGSFHNGMDALRFIQQNPIDLIFLDIQMEGLNGIQVLESLKTRPHIILTTAYSNYAIKAFDLQVDDYLLKPFSFERFIQAVQKACNVNQPIIKDANDFIFIKTDYRLMKVLLSDILYIEGMRDYRCVFMSTGKLLTLATFSDLQQQLPCSLFVRVHKSYIVSLRHIKSIEHHRIYIKDQVIPVSESYRKPFYDLLSFGNK